MASQAQPSPQQRLDLFRAQPAVADRLQTLGIVTTAADRKAGYRYQLSILRAEYNRPN
jgi:hypothetical protein